MGYPPCLLFLLFLMNLCPGAGFGQTQGPGAFNPAQSSYLWPTEASPYLSSTFGETRSAHFHSALDIKTWGRRGYKVFATRAGVLHRIAIGPRGYGKVVYLKHEDGSYSVYAHLLAFNREVQQLADSIRLSEEFAFEIDRFVEYHNIRFEQGEVIGYSGASGIGPPHLHFELRTPHHRPFNPLLTNLDVEDTIPPTIQAVSVEPLAPYSNIEGKNHIYTRPRRTSGGRHRLGSIAVGGPVGIGVKAFDRADRVRNSYAVYELSMQVNGKTVFHARADSFAYHETGQMFIDRVYPLLKKTGEGYQRLYLADGNTLPFYREAGRGILDLEPGSHEVVIKATDYFGNSSRASLELQVRPVAKQHPGRSKKPAGPGLSEPAASYHSWGWYANWFTVPEREFRQLTVGTADSSRFIPHEGQITVNLKNLDNLFIRPGGGRPVILRRLHPGSTHYLGTADSEDFALFPAHTVHDTLSVGMVVRRFSADSIRVEVLPEAYPLRDTYRFYIKKDPALTDTSKLAFYRRDKKKKQWSLVTTRFSEGLMIANPESLGSFVSLRDTTAPSVSPPRLTRRPDGHWQILLGVEDDLSGIDYRRTIFRVNGSRGIAEYAPEDRQIAYYHPDFAPAGKMEIDIVLVDRMGNRRRRSFQLDSPAGNAKK